jgi:protein ImuA
MTGSKADIIAELQRDILSLQGFKTVSKNTALDAGLGTIKNAFPNASFPLGAIHEFISTGIEDAAATSGFVAGLISSLMNSNGALIWISASRTIFPPALKSFGISPDRIIFIDLRKEKEIMWAMEEALKCKGLFAVIGEMQELNFTSSRRLQLAVEQSRVTGFILRRNPRSLNTTACVTRWKITSLSSELVDDMPGVGFPRWNVELLKVRNGRPGTWQIEFAVGRFRHISKAVAIPLIQKKKTG